MKRALPALALVAFAVCLLGTPARADPLDPPPGNRPVHVSVGVYIRNLSAIDERSESVSVVADLNARWRDARLAHAGDLKLVDPASIWTPEFAIANAKTPRQVAQRLARVAADGTVDYAERFAADLSISLALKRFPFDSQRLDLAVQSFADDAGTVVLGPGGALAGRTTDAYAPLSEWSFGRLTSYVALDRSGSRGRDYSRYVLSVHLKRHPGFYIWKVFVPLLLFAILAWSALLIDFAEFQAAIGVAITSLLSAVAYSFVINGDLPKVSYVTLTDGFLFLCYLVVFATILALVGLHVIHARGDRARADTYRRASLAIMPLAFAAGVAVVALTTL